MSDDCIVNYESWWRKKTTYICFIIFLISIYAHQSCRCESHQIKIVLCSISIHIWHHTITTTKKLMYHRTSFTLFVQHSSLDKYPFFCIAVLHINSLKTLSIISISRRANYIFTAASYHSCSTFFLATRKLSAIYTKDPIAYMDTGACMCYVCVYNILEHLNVCEKNVEKAAIRA